MSRAERAKELFQQGYACSQAVVLAFADVCKTEEDALSKMALPFGGGLGRLRLTCGAVSGMLMAFGYLQGYETPETGDIKMKHYEQTRALCDAFKEKNGSIICRDILKTAEVGGAPSPRTPEYYNERPCDRCVRTASEILEEYLEQNIA